MNSRQTKILVGGALVAGSVAGAYFLLNKNKDSKATNDSANAVPKETVIKVLKEIQRDMFDFMTNVSMISNQIKEQSRGRAQAQDIKEFILNLNPTTKDQIKKISDSICKKHGVTEKDLRYAIEVAYVEDSEIKVLLNEAKTSLDKAFMGIAPDLRTELPPSLTPAFTLELMKKIMKETVYKIYGFLQELKEKGVTISFNDPQVMMGLQELGLEELRVKILADEGLDKFQDSPLKIFQYATQKYSSEDTGAFRQKFMKLEMQNQKAMEAIMKDSPDAHLHIEAIGSHLVAKEEDLTLSSQLKKDISQKAEEGKNEASSNVEDAETAALNQIKELRREVSIQLKSTLEDSSFPKDLVESAITTLFNVFDKVEKNSLSKSGKFSPENEASQEKAPVEENAVAQEEGKKPNGEIAVENQEAQEVQDAEKPVENIENGEAVDVEVKEGEVAEEENKEVVENHVVVDEEVAKEEPIVEEEKVVEENKEGESQDQPEIAQSE